MSASVSKVTVVEDFRDKKGVGPVFKTTPNFFQTINPDHAEFILLASKVLSEFRKDWIESHPDGWAKGIEMDQIPVTTDGMIMGYMVVSEIDGESYDYAPAKTVEETG